ncbi:MAG: M23 family metallopeptidase [Anaerolineae bacterium]|nr:M23 family metallopeptidase [Anaerolineae bacterium]
MDVRPAGGNAMTRPPGVLAILLIVAAVLPQVALARQIEPPPPAPETPPFRLPFDIPPGPGSWFLVQPYGSTRQAYLRRVSWYGGGQGVHFGVDFAAPCGTPVVAVDSGTIIKIDAQEHGAGPHNLLILHENGFVSLYGHLLERPPFAAFTPVQAGQAIGVTGDPDLTCSSRPHLHLEIRDRSLYYGYDPVNFIATDWDSLALVSPGMAFQRDLDAPRRWALPGDQPVVRFGDGLLNAFARPWPPDTLGW